MILRKYTPWNLLIKSRAITLSRSSQYRAFSRAVMDEKSSSPLFYIGGGGGGAVVTNDWCIMDDMNAHKNIDSRLFR